jgi:poly(A) polymerase
MALDLESPERLIDPLGGAADLSSKLLRACSTHSFQDDPVRVIRAVRYAVNLSLTILPDTLAALKPAVPRLVDVSQERNRDELLKVLETGKPEIGLELLQRLGILEVLRIHSPAADWVAAVQHVGAFEALLAGLEGIGKSESAQALPITSYLLRMGRFRMVLLEHFHQSYSSGRTCHTLDLLAAYLTHFTRTDFENSVERLVLSNEEKAHLLNLYEHRMDLNDFPVYPERRQIYRFFKESSLDQCFLWLSDLFRLPATEHSTQSWLDALEKCEQLVEAWVEKPELLSPTPLLNGKDLMLYFDLPPGKLLGSLLEALLEEQAAGTITSREEALQWVENHLPARGLQ